MTGHDIILHQSLHGYDDGHRLLASSVELSPGDAKTMLQLSDSSGSGIRSDGDEYLTGYPLRGGFYALARTWPAPEMARPGCVWTHTLLVDFADLALVPDLSFLSNWFSRPSPNTLGTYRKPLVAAGMTACPEGVASISEAAGILASLYQHPAERIVAPRMGREQSEALAFAIWSQQWPRLRRAFRFCTNAVTDRSSEGNVFDLQLAGGETAIRSRFPKARSPTAAERPFSLWLELALADLLHANASGLRSFLHGIGGDVEQGRRSFTPLVQLHADLIGKEENFSLLADAIHLLTTELANVEASDLRASVARTATRHIPAIDEAGVAFVVANLSRLDLFNIDKAQLGHDLMSRSPEVFRDLLLGDGIAFETAVAGLKAVTVEDALALSERFPETLALLLEARPHLYRSVEFWTRRRLSPVSAVVPAAMLEKPEEVVTAVILAGRTDLVGPVYEAFGRREVLSVAAGMLSGPPESNLSAWIAEGVRDPDVVGALLASGRGWSPHFLLSVAKSLPPDTVPNAYGDDPWLIAARASKPEGLDNYLKAYLLTRALGGSSRNSAELAVLGFRDIHEATARGWLGDDAWSMLSQRLPHALLGFDWDRCWRLRAALIDLFVDRRLSPMVMADAAFDNDLFISLVHWAARSKRGREFMGGVADALRASGSQAKAKEVMRICEDKWLF